VCPAVRAAVAEQWAWVSETRRGPKTVKSGRELFTPKTDKNRDYIFGCCISEGRGRDVDSDRDRDTCLRWWETRLRCRLCS